MWSSTLRFSGGLFAEDRPLEGFELGNELLFTAADVLVAKLMETRAVVEFGEVGKFVADDIVAQFIGQEHRHV